VLITMLDEHHNPLSKPILPPVHFRHATAANDVQTLIGAVVAIAGTAFGLSGWNYHLGCLASPVADRNAKPETESE
jgi:hypothetical protein